MSQLSELLKKIMPFAPTVAGILGGPAAGLAVEALGSALGINGATKDNVTEKLASMQMTGEQISQLKQAELVLQAEMKRLEISEDQLVYADRDSARNREIKTGDSWTPRIIAAIFIVGWFSIQWFLLSHVIATEMREIIMRTLGTLDMGLGLILGYYFGSSAGSVGKTAALERLATK